MHWDNAFEHAKIWLDTNPQKGIRRIIKEWFGSKPWWKQIRLWSDKDLNNLILRIYLRESKKFKSDILNPTYNKRRSKMLLEHYRLMEMPKHIWVVELSRYQDLNEIYDRKICSITNN
jgi:hypothetical protein